MLVVIVWVGRGKREGGLQWGLVGTITSRTEWIIGRSRDAEGVSVGGADARVIGIDGPKFISGLREPVATCGIIEHAVDVTDSDCEMSVGLDGCYWSLNGLKEALRDVDEAGDVGS
jgi:hypothetical protein